MIKLFIIITLLTISCHSWTLNGYNSKQSVKTVIPPNCDKDEMLCEDFRRCIPKFRQCDGQQDCIDNSDEKNCANKCPGNNFKCNNGKCIETGWVCDSMDDCGDNSDEGNCLGLEHLPCSFGYYRCKDGPCITALKVCDKKRDCPNGDDETRCPQLVIKETNETPTNKTERHYQIPATNTNWQFNPRAPYSMKNSYLSQDVQRVLHGFNKTFAENRTHHTIATTTTTTTTKVTTTSPSTKVNFRLSSTIKREPIFYETYEIDENLKCSDKEFRCKDGLRCIPKKERCDGKLDCVDHSDEENCNKGNCHYGLFRCVSGKCAISSWKCNATDWSGRRIAVQSGDFEVFL